MVETLFSVTVSFSYQFRVRAMTHLGMLWRALVGQEVSMPVPLLGVLGCPLSSYIGECQDCFMFSVTVDFIFVCPHICKIITVQDFIEGRGKGGGGGNYCFRSINLTPNWL